MKNVTISLDEELLERSRAFARRQGKSFNDLVRELLRKEAGHDPKERAELFFETADRLDAKSADGKPLTREEAHSRGE